VDLAGDYDLASATYAETWQAFMEPVNKGLLDQWAPPHQGSVLDLGCGTGLVLDHLRQREFGGNYFGIDASSGMLSLVSKGPGVELHHGDVHDLLPMLPDKSFDGVTALWSWEYMDRKKLLPHIRRVLSPGGQVVLLANRRDTIPELGGAFLRLMARQPGDIRKVFHLALRMPRSAAQLGRELAWAGFEASYPSDGERIRSHETAEGAIAWGFRTGALAGTRCVLDLPNLEVRLAEMLERNDSSMDAYSTTHRYASVVGTLQC
jgi:ubiquinone/menaquinone biosynthesis C-methylase UbiE